MNVLICSSNGDVSGASLSMLRLAKHLRDELNINVSVSVPCEGDIQQIAQKEEIPCYFIKEVRWTWAVPYGEKPPIKSQVGLILKKEINRKAVKKFKIILKDNNIDVVHINTLTCHCAALAAHELGIPVVWHIREFLEEDIGVYFWDREYAYELINKSDKIIAISQSIFEKYAKHFSRYKLIKTLNGIDEKTYGIENHRIFDDANIHLAIIGMVKEAKGQLDLVRALGILNKKGIKNFTLEIVGSGDEAYIYKIKHTIAELNISDKVSFTGQVSNVKEVLQRTDIACICSKMEAFGRSTVEAMMAGCLVIGANTGGTAELINNEETGLLYQQGNVESLADKIAFALKHPDVSQSIAKNGNLIARNRYSSYSNACEIAKVYSEIQNANQE